MTRDSFISIWGSMAALARSIGEGETTVRNWFLRGSIPFRYDKQIIQAAKVAGRKISHEDMFALRVNISGNAEDAA